MRRLLCITGLSALLLVGALPRLHGEAQSVSSPAEKLDEFIRAALR